MISIIVATAKNGVIGKGNELPWKLPGEMAYFKAKTTGHPIIMGSKTHESIGRPLLDRTNIVLSRNVDYAADGCFVFKNLADCINFAKKSEGSDEIFIIGGEKVYELGVEVAARIYLTEVNANITGDKFFRFNKSNWQQISSEFHPADTYNKFDYTFIVLDRKH